MQYFIFYNYFLLFHFPSDRLLPSSFETLFGQFHFWGQIELQTLSAGWRGFKYIATHNRPDDDQVMLVVMTMMPMTIIMMPMTIQLNKLHDVDGDDDSRWYPGLTLI